MKNEERTKKENEIFGQFDFCQNLMTRLKYDMLNGSEKQDKDPWDNYDTVTNHTRYAEDVRRIRRELMILIKKLEG